MTVVIVVDGSIREMLTVDEAVEIVDDADVVDVVNTMDEVDVFVNTDVVVTVVVEVFVGPLVPVYKKYLEYRDDIEREYQGESNIEMCVFEILPFWNWFFGDRFSVMSCIEIWTRLLLLW